MRLRRRTADLGLPIAQAVLPIGGRGHSNESSAWVPVVGPLAGAVLAGLFSHVSI
ncbi:MAG: glpF [Modestobacter sp.]|jgi:glycerol uptake facilitator protein|nr:glpF [Modestobacter sp.]